VRAKIQMLGTLVKGGVENEKVLTDTGILQDIG
jgi:hypothetical protein